MQDWPTISFMKIYPVEIIKEPKGYSKIFVLS